MMKQYQYLLITSHNHQSVNEQSHSNDNYYTLQNNEKIAIEYKSLFGSQDRHDHYMKSKQCSSKQFIFVKKYTKI